MIFQPISILDLIHRGDSFIDLKFQFTWMICANTVFQTPSIFALIEWFKFFLLKNKIKVKKLSSHFSTYKLQVKMKRIACEDDVIFQFDDSYEEKKKKKNKNLSIKLKVNTVWYAIIWPRKIKTKSFHWHGYRKAI